MDKAEAELQALSSAVDEATADLAKANAATESSRNQYIRLNADFDNYRKRSVCCQCPKQYCVWGAVLHLGLCDSEPEPVVETKMPVQGYGSTYAAVQVCSGAVWDI